MCDAVYEIRNDMLNNQPAAAASSSQIHFLREIHFKNFQQSIIDALDVYIVDMNSQDKKGWQDKVLAFKRKIVLLPSQQCSLFDLKNELDLFCGELRSPFNQLLSAVVGPLWSKVSGNVTHAQGCNLQSALDSIAKQICPFAAIYIFNEIVVAKNTRMQKPIQPSVSTNGSEYISFNMLLSSFEYLSPEGLRMLNIIVSHSELVEAFLHEAKDYADKEINAHVLLQDYISARRNQFKPC